jgi:hypothetical protein
MDSAATCFWVGMAGVLAVAVVLRRWHAEDMGRRIAETHGARVVRRRVNAPVRRRASSRDATPRDAAFPDGAQRASA